MAYLSQFVNPAQQTQQPTNAANDVTSYASLPLSPYFEAGRRSLNDQYSQTLAQINAGRSQVQPQLNLGLARLGTDQGIDYRRLQSTLADRGIYNSGVTNTSRNQLFTQYDRQRQDYAQQAQDQLGNFAQQDAQARLSYVQGLQQLLLAAAQAAAADPGLGSPYGSYSSTAGLPDYTQYFNPFA